MLDEVLCPSASSGRTAAVLRIGETMCLAVPAEVKDMAQGMATCAVEGGEVQIQASLVLLDEEVALGDYVLVHAGFALRRLDRQEALETLKLLREMARHIEAEVSW